MQGDPFATHHFHNFNKVNEQKVIMPWTMKLPILIRNETCLSFLFREYICFVLTYSFWFTFELPPPSDIVLTFDWLQ